MRRTCNYRGVKPKQQSAQSCHNRTLQDIGIEFHLYFASFFAVMRILASPSTAFLLDLHLTRAAYALDGIGFPGDYRVISSRSM